MALAIEVIKMIGGHILLIVDGQQPHHILTSC